MAEETLGSSQGGVDTDLAARRGGADNERVLSGDASEEGAGPRAHVLIWLIGVVVASLLPFGFLWLAASPERPAPTFSAWCAKGDIFIISITLIIAGFTEIVLIVGRIGREKRQQVPLALIILGGLLLVLADAAKYAGTTASESPAGDTSTATTAATHIPHVLGRASSTGAHVVWWSVGLFIAAAVHSSICVRMAAGVHGARIGREARP